MKNLPTYVILILVIGLVGTTLLLNFNKERNPSNERTITATGNSESTIKPDKVEVYIKVYTQGDSADQVKDNNTKISNSVIAALKNEGIKDSDIETTQYYLNPRQRYDEKTNTFIQEGFELYNVMKVSSSNIDMAGKIIDVSIGAGATGIDSVQFTLSKNKEEEVRTDTLKIASQNARKKAEAVAEGLNVKLGEIQSISESNFNIFPYIYAKEDIAISSGGAAPPQINPQNLQISASVTVIYKLK